MDSIEFFYNKPIRIYCHLLSGRFPEYSAVEVAVRSNSPQTREDDGRSAIVRSVVIPLKALLAR